MERERIPVAYKPKKGDAVRCITEDVWDKLTIGKVYVVSDFYSNNYDETFVYLVGFKDVIFSSEHFIKLVADRVCVARERL